MFYSHPGNNSFPRWALGYAASLVEELSGTFLITDTRLLSVKTMGLFHNKRLRIMNNSIFFFKNASSLPSRSRNPFKQRLLQNFISPLIPPISLPSSLPSYFCRISRSNFKVWLLVDNFVSNVSVDGRDDGRDMGEMTGGIKTATFLCLKAF